MKHTFRTRRRIINYYETKIITDLNRQRIELKKQSDKELENQKREHDKEIEKIKQEYEQAKRILENEHNIKMMIESKRVENELLKVVRVLNKQDEINKEKSETLDALRQIFSQAKVIQTAIETKAINDKVETAVYLNLLGALRNLQQGMDEGRIVTPMATVTTLGNK